MRKLIFITWVLITQINYAQTTIDIGDFDEVKIFDKLNVTLIASNENKAVITGTDQSNIEIVNKNRLLKIRLPITKLLSGEAVKVSLYFKKILSIDANEGSIVTCADTFKQTSLDLFTQEGAQITAILDVDKATIKAFTGGIISITGKAAIQTISINSGGILNARELETLQTTVRVSAGGNAEVNASTLVDAKVKAGGTITILGKPKQIRQETLMGGSIIEK